MYFIQRDIYWLFIGKSRKNDFVFLFKNIFNGLFWYKSFERFNFYFKVSVGES